MTKLQMTHYQRKRPQWLDDAGMWLLAALAGYVGALAALLTWKILTGRM